MSIDIHSKGKFPFIIYSFTYFLPPSVIHSSPSQGCFGDSDLSDVLLGVDGVVKSSVSRVHVVDGPVDPSCFMITGQCQLQVSNASIQIIGSLCSGCSILPFITLPYPILPSATDESILPLHAASSSSGDLGLGAGAVPQAGPGLGLNTYMLKTKQPQVAGRSAVRYDQVTTTHSLNVFDVSKEMNISACC